MAPVFLLLGIVLGGSAQGIWSNMALQIAAVGILVWAALDQSPRPASAGVGQLWVLVALAIGLIVLQLIPLPAGAWSSLPGREPVVGGFGLLGVDPGWLPISLSPYDTLALLPALLPPIAMLGLLLRLRAFTENRLAGALLLGVTVSIALGVAQVASGGDGWYLYRFVNLGAATGFFANSNHFASLLLASLPFLAAEANELRNRTRKPAQRMMIVVLAVALSVLVIVGIILCDSMAVLMLLPPVALASGLMVLPVSARLVRAGWIGIAALGLVGIAGSTYLIRAETGAGTALATSRAVIWETSVDAITDHLPLGAGLGTFPDIYAQYENADQVDRTFINHAHNDYLEIALEAGVPGIILLVLFLIWWLRRSIIAWRSAEASVHMKAASIASGALLAHSLVDFPLRTAALSMIFAMCLALLAFPRRQGDAERAGDLRPTRHVTL